MQDEPLFLPKRGVALKSRIAMDVAAAVDRDRPFRVADIADRAATVDAGREVVARVGADETATADRGGDVAGRDLTGIDIATAGHRDCQFGLPRKRPFDPNLPTAANGQGV